MDGVIADSNPYHRTAWEAFNRGYGLATTEAMHQRMYGRRNDQIVRDFFGAALSTQEVEARGSAKEALYREAIAGRVEAMLVPGLRDFLNRYRAIPKAVATNAEPANVDFLLDQANLRPFFFVVLNGPQVSHPKPDPEIYLRAAELLGVEPAGCIVFEDSYSGVAAGRAAGMKVIGLATTHDYLPGTELTVDNFRNRELHAWLSVELSAER
jgi:HAD superfamily hydrolase (TIGR01509 family)